MGRNLRLDWRALALLGALLSIIVKWPALVCAMPTVLLPMTTAESSTPANPLVTSNNRTSNQTLSAMWQLKHLTSCNSTTFNNNKNYNESDSNQNENENANENKSENFQNQNNETSKLFNLSQQETTSDETEHATPQQLSNEQALATVATKNEQLNSTQRLKILNLIANKRKRKKSNDESNQSNLNNNSNNESTTIVSKINFSHSLKPTILNLVSSESMQTSNSEKRTLNSTNAANMTVNHSSTSVKLSQQTAKSTTSSPDIESTLLPPLTNVSFDSDYHSDLSTFTFSSSHHVAILSRTERSIRTNSNVVTHRYGSSDRGDAIMRRATEASKTKRLNNSRNNITNNNNNNNNNNDNSNLINHHFDTLDRNERATAAYDPNRKHQLCIQSHCIEILRDGTIKGTKNYESEYTILQRSVHDIGTVKFRSVATCLYICMNACGSIYASKEFHNDCVFNETMTAQNYNMYFSTYNSIPEKKTFYIAFNRHGQPRKLYTLKNGLLGNSAAFTNIITKPINDERSVELIKRTFGANRILHPIRQLCDTGEPLFELIDSEHLKRPPQCNPNNNTNKKNKNNKNSSHNNNNSNNNINNNSNNSSSSSDSDGYSRNSSNSNGQLLPAVPVANDKVSLQLNPSSDSDSSSSSSISNSPVNSKSHEPATVDSDSLTNSSNSSSNTSGDAPHQQHSGPRKKKKRRKCRPHENEQQHNCHRRPQALKKKGNGHQKKCRELLAQKALEVQASGTFVVNGTQIHCGPKRFGARKQGGKKLSSNGNGDGTKRQNANGNRRGKKNHGGKKLQNGGRKAKKQQSSSNHSGGEKRQRKHPSTTSTASTSLSSTLKPLYYSSTAPFNAEPQYATAPIAAYDLSNDRGEREQRNVHSIVQNPLGEHVDADSSDEHDEDVDADDAEADADADDDVDHDVIDVDTGDDDNSLEDHRHVNAQQPSSSGDVYYYDTTDYLPLGLWELFALIWITRWFLRIRI